MRHVRTRTHFSSRTGSATPSSLEYCPSVNWNDSATLTCRRHYLLAWPSSRCVRMILIIAIGFAFRAYWTHHM